jgi:ethanolamine utilization cobalamin adenosyltransferase
VIVTESALREQLRQPRAGARVSVPPGSSLSPAARDFVAQWQLEVVRDGGVSSADTGSGSRGRRSARTGAPDWERPSTFPVVHEGAPPRCVCCGGGVTGKPDGLTQLNDCHFAPKTHARIRLRGRVDGLQALAMLAVARAGAAGVPALQADLGTVAAYCRELMSAEYNERPAAPPAIGEVDEEAIHRATHDPTGTLGVGHVLPRETDPEVLHWLNLLRTQVREAELVALDAFGSPHHGYGASIVHGLNRLSSLVYYLELRLVAGREEP